MSKKVPIRKKQRQGRIAGAGMAGRREQAESLPMAAKRTGPVEPFTTLTQWRIFRDLTQEQVGNSLGVGSAAIHKWEAGKVIPTVSRLRQLAEIYDTTPDALFYPPADKERVELLRRANSILVRMTPDQADRWLGVAEDLMGERPEQPGK